MHRKNPSSDPSAHMSPARSLSPFTRYRSARSLSPFTRYRSSFHSSHTRRWQWPTMPRLFTSPGLLRTTRVLPLPERQSSRPHKRLTHSPPHILTLSSLVLQTFFSLAVYRRAPDGSRRSRAAHPPSSTSPSVSQEAHDSQIEREAAL